MTNIELESSDGFRFGAYRSAPRSTPKAGLVVVQEIFGVNAHIRDVTDRFAAAGYLAIAPAIFDRVERGVELGYDPPGFAKGRELVGKLDADAMLTDLEAAVVEAASEAGPVATIGYCFGGSVVWAMAARLETICCAVSYYGSRIAQYSDLVPRVPVMMHVGEHDVSFPIETVRRIAGRHASVVLHEYDAGHGFNCDHRADFSPEASRAAFDRTLAFLDAHTATR